MEERDEAVGLGAVVPQADGDSRELHIAADDGMPVPTEDEDRERPLTVGDVLGV